MKLKYYVFIIQNIIIFNEYFVTNGKPLCGANIYHPEGNEFNYVAGVIRVNPTNNTLIRKICMGAFISKRHVLTAAHCLEDEQLSRTEVVAGSRNFTQGVRMNLYWWLTYNWWALQLGHNLEFSLNDIAVFKLIRNSPDSVAIIPLTDLSNADLEQRWAVMASWTAASGSIMPGLLDIADVRILTNKKCNHVRKKYRGPEPIHWRYLCSQADPFILLDTGDSGGPLMHNNVIVGINVGFYPPMPGNNVPPGKKINIHIGIQYYRTFIIAAMEMD